MARNLKRTAAAATAEETPQANVVEIPEDEQWRIVEETGILKSIPMARPTPHASPAAAPQEADDDDEASFSPLCTEIFNAILLIIPFSSLYVMMDILAHRQYGQHFTTLGILEGASSRIFLLSLFVFFTTRHKADRRMQAFLFAASVASGIRLIYVVNRSNWRVVMRQCPPLGTLWVYTIVQLQLLPAVGALSLVAGWVWWKDMQIVFA